MNSMVFALINNDQNSVDKLLNYRRELLKSMILTENLLKCRKYLPIHYIFQHGTME